MTAPQNVPGDVTIKTISMFTDRGIMNITEHVQLMSITESIFTPGVLAELTIWDTKNIASMLPILGGERLTIELNTPGRKDAKFELAVTAFINGTPSDNRRSKVYTLIATSPEVVVNRTCQVCKAYNTNISNMVEDVLKSYLKTKRPVSVQQTRGIQKVIVPSIQPFEAVKMLRKRAISIDDKSSSYVFFENREGFHFKTLEKLMSSTSVGDRVFFDDATLRTDVKKSGFRNLISYDQPEQFDIVDRLDKGGMAHEVKKFDFKTLEYKSTVHKFNSSDFINADGRLKDLDSRELKQLGQSAGSNVWVPHDSSMPNTFLPDGLGARANGGALYSQGSLLIHVFGDSELTAGQAIEVNINETSTATQAPQEHAQLSGKYIIGFIRHIIAPEGNNPRYTCSIEAYKGGYKDKLK